MRIAVSGTHGVGKTTLIEDFISARPDYMMVQEPYWLMSDEGTPFADGPTSADLELQLDRSCSLLLADRGQSQIIFDRSPLDFIAYLDVVSATEGHEWSPTGKLLSRVEKALAAIDLLVFVPLMQPDDIVVSIEYPRLRSRVDARLKAIIRRDDLGLIDLVPRVFELAGTRDARIQKLLAQVPAAPKGE